MNRDWLPLHTTPWTLGLILSLLLVLAQALSLPSQIDRWLYDLSIASASTQAADDVAIVTIDDDSLNRLGRWPWPRYLHAELIDRLQASGADTIVFDILFQEPSADDPILAQSMAAHGQVILPLSLSPGPDPDLVTEHLPTPVLADAAAGFGHAHVELDRDGIARGIDLYKVLGNDRWPSLSLAAFEAGSNGLQPLHAGSGFRAVPLAAASGRIPSYSFVRVLEQTLTPDTFAGKTVFVGATAAGLGDILPTALSGRGHPIAGVEFHANAFSALSRNLLIKPAPEWLGWVLPLLATVLLSLVLPAIRPSRTLIACALLAATLLCLYLAGLFVARLWLPIASTLLMVVLAVPVASGLRLAIINRFLGQQLDNLARTPRVTLPQPADQHPAVLLEYFQALFQPRGWLLTRGRQILSTQGLDTGDIPLHLVPGRWYSDNNRSWILLQRGPVRYTLGLLLPNDLSREVIQRYLRHLPLQDSAENPDPEKPRDNISTRIEQVRTATSSLNHMQKFIRHSFERMPDGVIVTDELGAIRFANGHIEEWFQEPRPSLEGLHLARLLEGHDPRDTPPWHETVSETLTLQQSRTVDLRIRGQDFLIHFAPFALPDSNQHGIIANISDISELREQQRQHREAIDFISHDVRSPLVSQLALIEQLKRNPGHVDAVHLEQLGRLARRSYNLAEEFVQLARAEQLTETRFYECELLAIVENASDSVCEQAAEKNIQLQLQGTEDLWMRGNAELLERAVINLLTNAVQYSPENSVVNMQVFRAGHQACLTVADEGTGINPEELPYLFDRFQRQKSTELARSTRGRVGAFIRGNCSKKTQGGDFGGFDTRRRVCLHPEATDYGSYRLTSAVITHLNPDTQMVLLTGSDGGLTSPLTSWARIEKYQVPSDRFSIS